jgi:triphosphoribosyl-dephospho-CoA synthase
VSIEARGPVARDAAANWGPDYTAPGMVNQSPHSGVPFQRKIADLAVGALCEEIRLTPKPGLVDLRQSRSQMSEIVRLLYRSAYSLRPAFEQFASAAREMPLGSQLRAQVGIIGRAGEQRMLAATGGLRGNRGALWTLGLLSAGLAHEGDCLNPIDFAAALARLPDPNSVPAGASHHWLQFRSGPRQPVTGAEHEAQMGFPHLVHVALPHLHHAMSNGANVSSARLDALLAVMATLEDPSLLTVGGRDGLELIQVSAAAVLAAGGCATRAGRKCMVALDELARSKRLEPRGSGDLLAATILLVSAGRAM